MTLSLWKKSLFVAVEFNFFSKSGEKGEIMRKTISASWFRVNSQVAKVFGAETIIILLYYISFESYFWQITRVTRINKYSRVLYTLLQGIN